MSESKRLTKTEDFDKEKDEHIIEALKLVKGLESKLKKIYSLRRSQDTPD